MDGIIIVNKPKGQTSFQVVQFIRRLTGVRKVGHTGTLDPLATGILLICIGKATRIVQSLMDGDKQYEGELILGITTDSQDADGKVLSRKSVCVTREDVEKVLEKFKGKIWQTPPMVSALHYKGKRLYQLAREGKVVERKPRQIHIFDLQLTDFQPGIHPKVRFSVTCSKGTYVRTLCADIGEILGCGAYQSELCRTRSGKFTHSQAKTLEELEEYKRRGKVSEVLLSISEVLKP